MRLLVVNCNTSPEVTATIAASAVSAASTGTQIETVQPAWGPASAEGYLESFATAAAVIDTIAGHPEDYDAIVMAGYGEHGREGVRQLVSVPVVDVTEASAFHAALLADRFAVLTTISSTLPGIRDSLHGCGMLDRVSELVALDIPVLSLHDDSPAVVDALASAAVPVLARGADAIVLGCAGFAGLDKRLEARLGVPVIDSVAAAVVVAEGLVRLGKSTSKAGPYRAPDRDKRWLGWSPGALWTTMEPAGFPAP